MLLLNVASDHVLTSIAKHPAWPNHDFFYHQKKTILNSPFPVLINFVWGTLYLRLSQRCVVGLYVTHNPVYVRFTATLNRTTCEHIDFHVTRQAKEWNFHNLFQLLFELEKKSSLVTRALSTKSCTRDTDSLHPYAQLTPRARMACLYHSCKIWQRKHSYPNLIPIIFKNSIH